MNKKILGASKEVIIIGIGLVLLSFILRMLGVFFTTGPVAGIVGLVAGIYGVLSLVIFLCLYAWAGMRAVKQYGMGLVDAGLVAAFSYLIASIVDYIFGMIGLFLFWCKAGVACQQPVAGAAFGVMMAGASGAMATLVIGVVILGGVVVNFVVGAGGGAIANMMAAPKKK